MKIHNKIFIAILYLTAFPLLAEDDPFSLGTGDGSFSREATPPLPSHRPTSELEIGLGSISQDSFKFGEYTGQEEKGPYVIGNLNIHRLGTVDSTTLDNDAALYWILKGRALGLNSRELGLETGVQGDYKLWVGYDQLPKFQTDTAKTPFRGVGGDTLTLPAGWVAATTTAGMTALNSSLQDLKISHERKNYKIGFSKLFGSHWGFKTQYQHETKEGKTITGAVIGNSGANPRSVLIPQPIDYVTHQFEAVLEFTGQKGQFELGYYGSLFNDKENSLTWENPYSTITTPPPGWSAAAGFPTGQGRIGLPPDNQFHQILASGGYAFTKNTRLTMYGAVGRMTQDETFLPYTVNSGLTAATPLPRTSLDGRIDTTLFDLHLLSHPLDPLNLIAHYRYDDRDNQTPQAQYIYIGGDSQNQGTVTTTNDKVRTNLPYGFKQQKLKGEADYEIWARTHLQGRYEYEETKRTFSEVKKTKEHTYKVELRKNASELVRGGVRFLQGFRRGSTYQGNLPYLLSYSNSFTGAQAANVRFDNHPLMRKFNLGNRDRTQFGAFVMAEPHEMATVQLAVDWNDNDYPRSTLGLRGSEGQIYTFDAALAPKDGLTAHAFYTYEHLKSDQKGRYFLGGAPKAIQSADSTRDWTAKQRDGVDTIGLGFEATPNLSKWKGGAEYTYARSRGKVHVRTGPSLVPAAINLPLLTTELHRLDVFLKYKIKESLSTKFNILYEKFNSQDWALDNTTATTLAGVILTGEKSPDYSVTVFGVSLLYAF
ncbi:MAG: MtrB/PioB family decaheme-associated outer membrane protein [Gammaproteobacteria bacterium]|nr:MtrB/PioB family decaheme-associated outer membrane protein [Gammaproteobacteria bacterium]